MPAWNFGLEIRPTTFFRLWFEAYRAKIPHFWITKKMHYLHMTFYVRTYLNQRLDILSCKQKQTWLVLKTLEGDWGDLQQIVELQFYPNQRYDNTHLWIVVVWIIFSKYLNNEAKRQFFQNLYGRHAGWMNWSSLTGFLSLIRAISLTTFKAPSIFVVS